MPSRVLLTMHVLVMLFQELRRPYRLLPNVPVFSRRVSTPKTSATIALAAFDKHFVAKQAREQSNGWKNSRTDGGDAKNEARNGEKRKNVLAPG